MKQLLTLVLVVAVVLGLFFVFREDAADPPRTPQPRQTVKPPQPTRPKIDREDMVVEKLEGGERIVPESMIEQREKRFPSEWKDAVSEELLVPLEDVWHVEPEEADLEADVVGTYFGIEVPRTELERYVALTEGKTMITTLMMSSIARAAAERRGDPFGLSDEDFDRLFTQWCETRGVTKEEGRIYASHVAKLPVEAAMRMRRLTWETILSYFPPGTGSFDQLPAEVQDDFPDTGEREQLVKVLGPLHEARQEFASADAGAKGAQAMASTIEMLALFWGASTIGPDELFRRSWTFLDDPAMPPHAVAGFYTGPIDDLETIPPWERARATGELQWVSTDEVYGAIEPALDEALLLDALRDLVWFRALEAELAEAGALPDTGSIWRDYAFRQIESKQGLLSFNYTLLELNGFPTESHWRAIERLRQGFFALQPDGWKDEDVLREHFDGHRLFVEGWRTDLDIALFPPRRFSPDGGVGELDWEYARERAQEFRDRVAAGEDFDALLEEHDAELRSNLEAALGAEAAQEFAREFRGGRLSDTVAGTSSLFKEKNYQALVQGTTLVRNAATRLSKGEVGPPWRTPVGWVVVRMRRAIPVRLEEEYEDVASIVEADFLDARFQKWSAEIVD